MDIKKINKNSSWACKELQSSSQIFLDHQGNNSDDEKILPETSKQYHQNLSLVSLCHFLMSHYNHQLTLKSVQIL